MDDVTEAGLSVGRGKNTIGASARVNGREKGLERGRGRRKGRRRGRGRGKSRNGSRSSRLLEEAVEELRLSRTQCEREMVKKELFEGTVQRRSRMLLKAVATNLRLETEVKGLPPTRFVFLVPLS